MKNDNKSTLGHDLLIKASWQRCDDYGLDPEAGPAAASASKGELKELQHQHHFLIDTTDHEVLPYYENILANSSCLIMLADQQGQVLNCWGDRRFVDNRKRHSFDEGVNWSERINGTNAIGTALATGQAVQVQRDEHYLKTNRFMIGSAAPIYDTNNELLAVLDVSSDAYLPQAHTLGMVKMMSQSVENRLIISKFGSDDFLMTFNTNTDNLDSQWAGLIAFNENGTIISANRRAEMLLRFELALTNVEEVFGCRLFDLKNHPEGEPIAVYALGKYQMFAMVKRPTTSHAIAPDFRDRVQREVQEHQGPTLEQISFGDVKVERCIRMAQTIMEKDIPILIHGETGVGKEAFVRALHQASSRRSFPLVVINCAAIPENQIESELFGYDRDDIGSAGLIRKAHRGTLFLDEVGEMPAAAQTRFLRVLEERKVSPLGSNTSYEVDIKIISSSKRSLKERISSGEFREDLYYRISGLNLELPPFRERGDKADIIRQVHRFNREESQPEALSDEVMQLLLRHGWPGNIRQLISVMQIALAMAGDEKIQPWHLPDDFFAEADQEPAAAKEPPQLASPKAAEPVVPTASSVSDETLRAYTLHKGNISRTAQALGISRNTLYKRLRELGIKN
ncbi:sigma-54-dependent Fis family transcriptional regulator [Marinobacterium arenosum]|uniref:sigma-54-dependent Fis family transcriptional regulator n=1 Tax=Marinobacterium arenosum TaxID=2862496 RepID=UPI001C96A748|nr:sigma-54-dependent Fis family transcriptional regulator [Marinobacterium arenosum]MBY4676734.1 sigma-54-dependent Fis family transcriptional regulator [Marinobacterium arenosum]